MNLMRALFHFLGAAYYGVAARHIHPDHPDAALVVMRHALHLTQLDAFLRTGR